MEIKASDLKVNSYKAIKEIYKEDIKVKLDTIKSNKFRIVKANLSTNK